MILSDTVTLLFIGGSVLLLTWAYFSGDGRKG